MQTRSLMEALGYAGLLPFYASAVAAWFPAHALHAISGKFFVLYGVVILAFLGGTLWGYAVQLQGSAKHLRLVLSNLVALFAAGVGLWSNLIWAAFALAVGQLLLLGFERGAGDCTGWYLRLRTRLSLGVMPAYLLFISGWYVTT